MLNIFGELVADLPAWQATLLLLGASLGMALGLEFVVLRGLLRYTNRTKTAYDNIVVSELRLPIVLTAGLVGVYLLTQVPPVVDNVLLDAEKLDRFFGKPALSVILVAWAIATNRVANQLMDAVKDADSRFDFEPVFSNVWTIVVTAGTVAVLLSVWDYSISPLLGAADVASIAVGFAALDTVANFFGGIALYFDDTYKIGDFVELDSGDAGTVVKVDVHSTPLMMRNGVLVTVPNSMLNASKVINHFGPQRRRRLKAPISVGYGTDIDAFEELALEVADAEPLVLESPKPRMRFRRFGDSGLEYDLLFWVGSPMRVKKARHELNRALYERLRAAGTEIPYQKRDDRLISDRDDSRPTDTTTQPDGASVTVEHDEPTVDDS